MSEGQNQSLRHWHASSCAGFMLTGEYRPVCSIVWVMPVCRFRQAFVARMDRIFKEIRHCGKTHDTYVICSLLRGPIQYDPPPITGRRGPLPGY